jgi:hypothetical protein
MMGCPPIYIYFRRNASYGPFPIFYFFKITIKFVKSIYISHMTSDHTNFIVILKSGRMGEASWNDV